MRPILKRAFFAALLSAFWSIPVFSGVAPQQLRPEEPFDLRTPPGLLPGELNHLSQVGYHSQGSYLVDFAKTPATTAQIQALLKTYAQERVLRLRSVLAAGALSKEDKKEALLLYSTRPAFLPLKDRRFLASINPMITGKLPDNLAFGERADPGAAGLVLAGQDNLSERFMRQVKLSGDAREQEALKESMGLLLATPTGRQLAEEFIKTGTPARISFVEIPGSTVLVENGKKLFYASGGESDFSGNTWAVRVNRDYLETDLVFRQQYMPATIGHELLGHGLESAKAEKAGVLEAYNGWYEGNETNASLVGWSVAAELGNKLDDMYMWNYLKNPKQYYADTQIDSLDYSTQFSRDDIQDPLGTLAMRRMRAQKEMFNVYAAVTEQEALRPLIEHFITVHRVSRAAFHALIEDIDNATQKNTPFANYKEIEAVVKHLDEVFKEYNSVEGAAKIKRVQAQFANDFFAQQEQQVASRTEYLRHLVQGKAYEPFSPPAPGQITRATFDKMIAEDKLTHPDVYRSAR